MNTQSNTQNFEVLQQKTVLFIGGGNMAGALIDGLIGAKQHGAVVNILVVDADEDKRTHFLSKGVEFTTPDDTQSFIDKADVVVLAVKPQILKDVCQNLQFKDKLVLSIAAGLSVQTLKSITKTDNIIRVMPNLPASTGFGAAGLFADCADDKRAVAQAIISASSVVVWVSDEAHLHAVTAVAGSAPAYFFYILKHMINKACALGLSYEDAHILACQSMQGAAIMAKNGDPKILQDNVTSKGGTTFAATSYMDEKQVGQVMQDAMQACYDRSVELGQ